MILEDKIQADCVSWFRNNFFYKRRQLFSVPNGGKRDKREAGRLKSTGVVAGIPDLIFVASGKTVFFELKTEVGTISPSQKIVHATLLNEGFPVYLIRSFEQFKNIMLLELNYLEDMETDPEQSIFKRLKDMTLDETETLKSPEDVQHIEKLLSLGIGSAEGYDITIDRQSKKYTKTKLLNYGER